MLRLPWRRQQQPGCFAVVGAHPELLQVLRATHALAETGWHLHVEPEHEQRWLHLQRHFDLSFAVGTEGVGQVRDFHVDHATPRTGLGELQRPLIYPRAIVDRCRSLWDAERPLGFTFAGLITDSRRQTLQAWADRTGVSAEVVASDRGRVWPGKAWDEDFFATLGRSRFVLCPNGDFVWTYRFFEAALCGALPVVEGEAVDYAGFRYARMSDDPANLQWNLEDALHNFALAQSLLCVPAPDLTHALQRAVQRSAVSG